MDKKLSGLIGRYEDEVRALTGKLESGAITPLAWRDTMRRLLVRYHTAAIIAGMGTAELTEEAVDILARTIEYGQFPYLDNFYTVVAAAVEYNPAWVTRALLYARSIKTSFYEGDIYRQVGRFLPLPAMPAQGTQCLSNCGCRWRVVAIDEEREDYDAYWERSLDDSCQTCIEREEQWNPVRIRGGILEA